MANGLYTAILIGFNYRDADPRENNEQIDLKFSWLQLQLKCIMQRQQPAC